MDGMDVLRFYWPLVRQLPNVLWMQVGNYRKCVGFIIVVLAVVTAFNRPLGRAMSTAWEGVSPWWAVVILVGLLVWGMLKANYEKFQSIERDAARAAETHAAELQEAQEGAAIERAILQTRIHELEDHRAPRLQIDPDVGSNGHFLYVSVTARSAPAVRGCYGRLVWIESSPPTHIDGLPYEAFPVPVPWMTEYGRFADVVDVGKVRSCRLAVAKETNTGLSFYAIPRLTPIRGGWSVAEHPLPYGHEYLCTFAIDSDAEEAVGIWVQIRITPDFDAEMVKATVHDTGIGQWPKTSVLAPPQS